MGPRYYEILGKTISLIHSSSAYQNYLKKKRAKEQKGLNKLIDFLDTYDERKRLERFRKKLYDDKPELKEKKRQYYWAHKHLKEFREKRRAYYLSPEAKFKLKLRRLKKKQNDTESLQNRKQNN